MADPKWETAPKKPCSQCGGDTGYRATDQRIDNPICTHCREESRTIHGTYRGYRTLKCRCDECKSWYISDKNKRATCTVDGCEHPQLGRQMCAKHYSDWHRGQAKYTISCHCGKTVQVGRRRTKHCSHQCGIDAVNAAIAGVSVSEWLQRPVHENARTRRQKRKREAFVEKVSRLEVFQRDNFRCHLCGKKTRLHSGKSWHALKATVDHVIPLSKGGTHEMANCRTACGLCNSSKGNRGGGEQLQLAI